MNMNMSASQATTSAHNSASNSRLFQTYNNDTIIERVTAIVNASKDQNLIQNFNKIQEGATGRTRLPLLALLRTDGDQTLENVNLFVQYLGRNWNTLSTEADILEVSCDIGLNPLLLSYLIAKLAMIRLARLGMNYQDTDVKAIFRHAVKNVAQWSSLLTSAELNDWEPFDDQIKQLVAKVVDKRPPEYSSDPMEYPYMSSKPADIVQLLEDACCSYALIDSQTSPAQSFRSRYFAMVQSSGVGKKRSVLELMKHGRRVFVVYVNLRKATSSRQTCRTPVIADLIDRDVRTSTHWQILMVAVQMAVKSLVDTDRLPNDADARMAFYTEQQDATLQTFWSLVSNNFVTMDQQVGFGDAAAHKWEKRRPDILKENAFTWVNADGQEMVLVLALDDCYESLQKDGKLLALQQALSYTQRTLTEVVSILIDTNVSLSQCAPPVGSHGSFSRVVSDTRLNTPFFDFPIDFSRQLRQRHYPESSPAEQYRTSVTLTVSAPSTSSSSTSSTSTDTAASAVVVQYNPVEEVLCSRPLFAINFCSTIDFLVQQSGSCSQATIERQFIACLDTVNDKLDAIPTNDQSQSIRNFSFAAIRWQAMTSSRVMMEGVLSQRLGLIRQMDPRMETIWCAYGLEPILGRFVASKMKIGTFLFESILQTLRDLQTQGQLHGYESRGDYGELVASILLSRAHDVADQLPAERPMMKNYQPVLLRDWLAQLFDDGASLWGELQVQAGSALDRACVYFHSVHRVESVSMPPITVEMVRWYLQRGTAMVAPRGLAVADLFIPFAVPHGDSLTIDLMDPTTYILGVMPVLVKNAIADGDNESLLCDMLFSDIIAQFPDAPRVGLVMHMNPDVGWEAASSASATALDTGSKDAFVLADTQKCPPRLTENGLDTPAAFVPCGFVKHFRNHIPCIQQGPDHGETTMRLLRSMLQFVPFAHRTTMTLQQYYRTRCGYTRTEAELQPAVRALGEAMFHINRQYGDKKATKTTKAAKSVAVAVATTAGGRSDPPASEEKKDDDTTAPTEAVVGSAPSRKRAATKVQPSPKRSRA